MSALVRPLAAGYVLLPADRHGTAGEAWFSRWKAGLAALASREGYALTAVFTDAAGRESGLYELMAYVTRVQASAVAVPAVDHLTHAACLWRADRLTVARFLRVPVLEAAPYRDHERYRIECVQHTQRLP